MNKINYINCLDGLPKMPDASVDVVYTDPPFGIDFNKKEGMYKRKKAFVNDGYTEPVEDYYQWSSKWIKELYRVLKPNGSGIICSGWSNVHHIMRALEESGFIIVNHIIWKYQFGVWTKKKFVTSHYVLIFFVKNIKKYTFNMECRFKSERTKDGNPNYKDREDVWCIKRDYNPGADKNANTQPVELVEKSLKYISNKGDIVLDPFMGGGTTALVAKQLDRQYVGFEINKKNKKYIEGRLKNV